MTSRLAALRGPTRLLLVVCVALSLHLADLRSQAGPGRRATVTTRSGTEAARGEALVQFRDGAIGALRSGPLAQYIDADESVTVGRRGLHRFRSRSFDVRVPTTTVVWQARLAGPARLRTELCISFS